MSSTTNIDQQKDETNKDPSEEERYRVLIEFAYKHLDFQMAELEAVLDMHGVKMGDETTCRIERLPNQSTDEECDRKSDTSNSTTKSSRRPFLILSLPLGSKLVPKEARARSAHDTAEAETMSTESVETNIASIILSRCTLVRNVMELWAFGTCMDSCAKATQEWLATSVCGRSVFPRVAPESWKISIQTLGSKFTREEQATMRSKFDFLKLTGPVLMKYPVNDFALIREVELDAAGGPLYPRHSHIHGEIIPENDARPPLACYFARTLCGSRTTKGRGVEQYSLKNRKYLGPTSMDAELSFIMTNLGQVKQSSIAFDPFVGTGSILLSCALRGAYCMGTDIDIRVLRGRNKEENVLANFRQFNLPRPELIRSDNAIYARHFRTNQCLYDSIVCDPPYGIRAGARKSGSKSDNPMPVSEEHRHDHIAQTKVYDVSDVMSDLLDVAARTLVMGGRLVYIIPSYKDFDPDSDLPHHECLKSVHICFQPLGSELGRRMVAMEKVKDYDASKRESYLATIWKNGPASAERCANIRDKILENARKKPGYEQKLAVRKEKRKATKEAKRRAKRAAAKTSEDS